MIHIPPVAPADIQDMVGLMNTVYLGQDEDGATVGVQISPGNMDALKAALVNAAINGTGEIDGLEALTSESATADLDPGTEGDQTIQSIVSAEIQEGMNEFNSAGNTKTIDDIFKETIEETIEELHSYDPDIFSGT